ncbi:MAG: hypothetical protein M3P24_06185, partial [Gemmatimonadota bacterium]|nr:hypothetical protein [Gemmatimonadota bacterium]
PWEPADTAEKAFSTEGIAPPPKTQVQHLLELAEASAELWHTPDLEAYATVQINGHAEHWPLSSASFANWLRLAFYRSESRPPGAQALAEAVSLLDARAQFEGPEYLVFVRVAEQGDRLYLDLCDSEWRVVEIDSRGWHVLERSPVRFRRARGMLPLPVPQAGASLESLVRPMLNVEDDTGWRLLVSWLLAALRPRGPYPLLVLQGEQGSAKSTTARVLRELVDPGSAIARSSPREERDLMVAARNGWVLSYDNLSRVQDWLSDALCRLSTGGAFATRQLYTDAEEVLFSAQRPIILNGIEELAERDDLRDRALIVTLPPIPEERRRDESTFWKEFERARPAILAGLLDAVSGAVRALPQMELSRRPRLADFALWATAAEEGLGWQPGAFMQAYEENRAAAVEISVEGNPVAQAVVSLAREREFKGTATELLQLLTRRVGEEQARRRDWPGTPRKLSGLLRRAGASLRASGVSVEYERESGGSRTRLISISPVAQRTAPTVPTVPQLLKSRADSTLPHREEWDDTDSSGLEPSYLRPAESPVSTGEWDGWDDRDDPVQASAEREHFEI